MHFVGSWQPPFTRCRGLKSIGTTIRRRAGAFRSKRSTGKEAWSQPPRLRVLEGVRHALPPGQRSSLKRPGWPCWLLAATRCIPASESSHRSSGMSTLAARRLPQAQKAAAWAVSRALAPAPADAQGRSSCSGLQGSAAAADGRAGWQRSGLQCVCLPSWCGTRSSAMGAAAAVVVPPAQQASSSCSCCCSCCPRCCCTVAARRRRQTMLMRQQ